MAPKRRKVFEENPHHFKGNREETEVLLEYIEYGLPVRVGNVTIDDAPEMGRLGGGWRGNGPMRISHFMGKERGYEDGSGLCSPGRWPRSQRNLPDSRPEVGGAYLSGRRLASDVDAEARRREVCCNAVRPW